MAVFNNIIAGNTLSEIEHSKLKREWVDQVFSSSFENNKKRGVAILFSKAVCYNSEQIFKDKDGRYVMVIGSIGGVKITIINIYAPNEDCPLFFREIAALVTDKSEGILIMGGDFNSILNSKLDRSPILIKPLSKTSKEITNLMNEMGLVDVWRFLHPKERDFTFFSHVHGSYSRIDYFCIPKADIYKVKECRIEPATISDHNPVIMKINLGLDTQFRYWRLNVSLLTNTQTKKEIQEALKEYFLINDDGNVSPSILWDAGKATIRGRIISIGSQLKKQRNLKQQEYENEVKRLEREHKINKKEETLKELKEVKQKLDEILTHKAEGALRYIKRNYYEMGNKASRLLAFQLRKDQASRIVPKIRHPVTKQIETQPKAIADIFAEYYQQLYKCQDQELKKEKILTFLKPLNLTKLSSEKANRLTDPITEDEIKETIIKLKNNKSPGVDGFSAEYYKVFVNDLTPILCKVYNYALKITRSTKIMVRCYNFSIV